MPTLRFASLLLALTLLSGCFAGKVKDESPWDLSKASELAVGTSTRADVLSTLGAPTSVVRLWRGEAYVYQHAISKRSGLWLLVLAFFREDTQRDAVTVIVDEGGTVQAVGTRQNAEKSAYGTPWGD